MFKSLLPLNMFIKKTLAVKLKYFLLLFFCILLTTNVEASKKGAQPVKKLGDALQIALPSLAASMTFAYRDFEGTLEFAKSFGTTLGVTYILKPIINEQRPISSSKLKEGRAPGNMSFPSGHTAAAFGGAAFLQMRYGWWFGAPCYLAASYVGFSRVYGQRHWFRDVLGGAAIAVAANVLFTTRYCGKKLQVDPILEEDRKGISLHWDL